jgi:hypothetical protein
MYEPPTLVMCDQQHCDFSCTFGCSEDILSVYANTVYFIVASAVTKAQNPIILACMGANALGVYVFTSFIIQYMSALRRVRRKAMAMVQDQKGKLTSFDAGRRCETLGDCVSCNCLGGVIWKRAHGTDRVCVWQAIGRGKCARRPFSMTCVHVGR